MESGKGTKEYQKVARISLRATFFALAGTILAAVLIYFVLKVIVNNPGIAPELKMAVLFAMAFHGLVFGFAGISLIARKKHRVDENGFSIAQVILLAYLVPAISIFTIIFAYIAYSPAGFYSIFLAFIFWISRIPLLFLVQVTVLAWIVCASKRNINKNDSHENEYLTIRKNLRSWRDFIFSRNLVIAILFGLGIWLAARFIISIETNWLPGQVYFSMRLDNNVFRPLVWITAVIGLAIAPWAEEIFFRERLSSILENRYGFLSAVLIGSALYAFLQLRPLLFLPAFIFGIGASWMGTRYGLKTLIVTHFIFNLLTLCLAWTQVI